MAIEKSNSISVSRKMVKQNWSKFTAVIHADSDTGPFLRTTTVGAYLSCSCKFCLGGRITTSMQAVTAPPPGWVAGVIFTVPESNPKGHGVCDGRPRSIFNFTETAGS